MLAQNRNYKACNIWFCEWACT